VMIHAAGGPGAGIVVGQSGARTTIVTARHLLLDRDDMLVTEDIQVEFSMLRGARFPAYIDATYVDRRLDLAVVFVDHRAASMVPRLRPAQFAESVSPTPPPDLKGEAVRVVGAARVPWGASPPGDSVVGTGTNRLLVRAAGARPGDSGGGAFDVFGRLLGMVSEFDASRGELHVVPMAVIQRQLRQWGIEYLLGIAGAPSGGPELLEALRGQAQLFVELPRDDAQPRYKLRVEASTSLARLHPNFRVEFPELASLRTVRLAAPAFEAVVDLAPIALAAELWMDTPDGRQTGPVPYKFDLAARALEALAAKFPPLEAEADNLKRNRRAYDLAMAQATVQNQTDAFRAMEASARATKTTVEKLNAQSDAERSHAVRQQALRDISVRFERMRAKCVSRPGVNWHCVVDAVAPYQAAVGGRLDQIFRAFRLGPGSNRHEGVLFPVEVPLDGADGIDKAIKAAIERLLSDGAKAIHADVVFADGQRLGPSILCEVGEGPIQGKMCQAPLPRSR